MAKKPRRRSAKRRGRRFPLLLLVVVALLAGAAGWYWWRGQTWRPSEERYPEQGALVGEGDGPVSFAVLAGLGARFVYLEASRGAKGRGWNGFPRRDRLTPRTLANFGGGPNPVEVNRQGAEMFSDQR